MNTRNYADVIVDEQIKGRVVVIIQEVPWIHWA